MEEEAREILRSGLKAKSAVQTNLAESIRRYIAVWRGRTRPSCTTSHSPSSEARLVIVLDTNVLSEVLKPAPSSAVVRWRAAQPPSTIYTTAITVAEILCGLELLAPGKRQQGCWPLSRRCSRNSSRSVSCRSTKRPAECLHALRPHPSAVGALSPNQMQ